MKYLAIIFNGILISMQLLISCKNANNHKEGQDIIDSNKNDSLKYNNLIDKTINELDEDSVELSSIYNSYLQQYSDSIKIDTTFNYSGSKVQICFQHYCTYDSTLILPEKYIEIYGIKKFVTHSFESSLSVKMNGKRIIDTIIKRSMFEDTIQTELVKYGVLLYPNLTFNKKNQIEIDYSLSIPLTDVGRMVSFPINNIK
ncbi:hypothetical protein CLV59_103296 [Chitinophaga dinghuensis]|uniref:Uncharacterized protein n=1 Tax=Chitinophaga dinghuensis TaxID=1539050 RepID=A0A327W3G7_9BACT|nr:hypothetical protein [Chitinophaga dinghuensis]RAJ83332.1 hypothetical protein CLV59_103296 [Chitinophaga dinghuensis]